VIADLQSDCRADALWDCQRRQRIESIDSASYPAMGSRHRGVLYNDFIQRLIDSEHQGADIPPIRQTDTFAYPHIL